MSHPSCPSTKLTIPVIVRYSTESVGVASNALASSSPFKVTGAPNVALETIKRGEDDTSETDGKRTVILRLFEQYGGHAKAALRM